MTNNITAEVDNFTEQSDAELREYDPVNNGLPLLNLQEKPVSFFEFWPAWFFYIPVVIYWLFLSIKYRSFGLPMAVNADIELGGMVGESKSEILQTAGTFAEGYILPFICLERPIVEATQNRDDFWLRFTNNLIEQAATKEIVLPFVIKPDLGCRGTGVQRIRSQEELIAYLVEFPARRKFMIQRLAPFSAEAGVFYERFPGEPNGRITSLTLKYRPYVTGDGKSNLAELIRQNARASKLRSLYFKKNQSRLSYVPSSGEHIPLAFAGSHCRGSVFRNGEPFITEPMQDAIDRVMKDFSNFHYGRLDVKFESIDTFMQGHNFAIIEVNGASSEATHIWDSRTSLSVAFKTLLSQYRTLFVMGDSAIRKGASVPSALTLIATWLRELVRAKEYPEVNE